MILSRRAAPTSVRQATGALAALLMLAALSLLVTPSSAAAAAVSRGPGYATRFTYLGIEVVDGVPTICIDSSAASPTGLQPGTSVRDPSTAYLLDRYASTSSDTTAAALAYIVKKKYDSNAGAADVALQERPEEPQIRAAISRLDADAAANAGPYRISPQISAVTGTVPTRGTVSGIAVRQVDGSYAALPGVSITLTLAGAAVFDSTGTSTRTMASTSATPSAAAWHATGEGAVSVTARANGLPPTTFIVHRKQAQGYQRVVSADTSPVAVSGQARLGTAVTAMYAPTVATQIQTAAVLGPGRSVPVSDRVSVNGARPDSTATVTVHYYWTPDRPVRSRTVPSGAVTLGESTVTVTTDSKGMGTGEASGPEVSRSFGWVVAVESIAATSSSKAYVSDFGVATESTQLPARPTVSTLVQSQPVGRGRVDLVDRVSVSGAYPHSTVRVEIPFYLDRVRPTPSPTVPGSATLAGTTSVLVSTDEAGEGSAQATLRGIPVPQSSWAVGMERIPAVAKTATAPAVVAYQAPYGQVAESAQLCSPVPSTQLQEQLLPGGTKVRLVDLVRVTGGCANSVVHVVVPFYLDTVRPVLGPAVPTTARLVGTVTVAVTTDDSGHGMATAAGPDVVVPTQAPVWAVGMERIEALPGTSTGPATLGTQAPYGQTGETVQVAAAVRAAAAALTVVGGTTAAAATPATALINAGLPGGGTGSPLFAGAALLALLGTVSGGVALRRRARAATQ